MKRLGKAEAKALYQDIKDARRGRPAPTADFKKLLRELAKGLG